MELNILSFLLLCLVAIEPMNGILLIHCCFYWGLEDFWCGLGGFSQKCVKSQNNLRYIIVSALHWNVVGVMAKVFLVGF